MTRYVSWKRAYIAGGGIPETWEKCWASACQPGMEKKGIIGRPISPTHRHQDGSQNHRHHEQSTSSQQTRIKNNVPKTTYQKKRWHKNYLAKDGVLFVEVRRVVQGEEKLAVVGAWLVLVCHRHLATMVELNAGVDLVPKSFPIDALSPFARAGRIPALYHELPDDAMEHRVVVVLRDIVRAGKRQAGCGW